MSVDVTDLRAFYAGPLGSVTKRLVGRAIAQAWSDLRGLSVLGLGYATPFLAEMEEAGPRFAFMPATQGVVNWPASGPSSSALVDPMMMPLADGSVDRVLVVHALETVESPSELLNEVWRVLNPGGRMILVCPNRRGLWSRMDTTPFGHGQPFSRRQLRHLMKGALFSPESWAEILYVPPLRSRFLLSGAAAWEQLGRSLSLPFAGLHVVEATKQLHRPIPVYERRRARHFSPVLVPSPVPTPT
ncbi:class I SAM-dependent methyltransferase [Enterovirga aerilata]|uniref:Class I SAM-dependent methyltransferase n=1 Tax=Enterovirga aerilata TaxID=2730920 RepID=A0A849I191_9HYPH|nr:class I SAM-dependent methyltransferase [Enterovirga sp. DB1703]NNM71108.1 class I SAM-dependent methyltransferase [Enterovirga sp. DB1703]